MDNETRREFYVYLDNLDSLIEKINECREGEKREKMLERIIEKKHIFDYETISLFVNNTSSN